MPEKIAESMQVIMEEVILDSDILNIVNRYYQPLTKIINSYRVSKKGAMILGISGCQGSGKTTLARYLDLVFRSIYKIKSIHLSLDDFYLSHKERKQLAHTVHPLLLTRGVPGTHNVRLLQSILDILLHNNKPIKIPKFNKAADDLFPEDSWPKASGPFDIIILEGWCLGAEAADAKELEIPINSLEKAKDKDSLWRKYVNSQLRTQYKNLFNKINYLVYLQAPNFDCVFQWRKKQEQQLMQAQKGCRNNKCMNDTQLKAFISYFERITCQCMKQLPEKADAIVSLNQSQVVTEIILQD